MNQNELAWQGTFGDKYQERSPGDVTCNRHFFYPILARIAGSETSFRSVVELGAGVGNNLRAISQILPDVHMTAVEINARACQKLQGLDRVTVVNASLLDLTPWPHDLSFTKGVLIHVKPDVLHVAYERLWQWSKRWILIAEYYNPTPIEVEYRGLKHMLWKRDFAGEMMDRFSGLKLVDHGFAYHRDEYPQDDLTWFLMEKT